MENIPIIYLYNKYDLLKTPLNKLLEENAMYSTLTNQDDIEDIYHFVCSWISKGWKEYKITFPYSEDYASFAFDNYIVSSMKNKNGIDCTVRINPRTEYKYRYLLEIIS